MAQTRWCPKCLGKRQKNKFMMFNNNFPTENNKGQNPTSHSRRFSIHPSREIFLAVESPAGNKKWTTPSFKWFNDPLWWVLRQLTQIEIIALFVTLNRSLTNGIYICIYIYRILRELQWMFHNVTDAVRISIQDLNIQLLIKYIYIIIYRYCIEY